MVLYCRILLHCIDIANICKWTAAVLILFPFNIFCTMINQYAPLIYFLITIVTWWLKAGTDVAIVRQRLVRHVPAATHTHAII